MRAAPLPTAVIGAAGCACSVVAVVAGGHAYTATSTPSTPWLQLIAPQGFDAGDSPVFGLLLFCGIAGLVVCWLLAIDSQSRGRLSLREVRLIGTAWSMPLALGPPLISKDVYAYAAQAFMQRDGLDVYRSSPSVLSSLQTPAAARAVAAVDPRWRHALSPYGPLATALERAAGALSGGSPFAVLIVLRVVAAVCVVAVAQSAAALAGAHATRAFVLVGLNPLMLVHALSAAHFEASMCALLLATLLAADRGRWTWAVALGCAAGLIKAPGLLAVPAVIAWHAMRSPALPRARQVRAGVADCLTAAAALTAMSLVVPDGWGWLRTVLTPAGGDPTSSASGVVRAALRAIVHTAPSAGMTTVIGGALAVAVLGWLGATISSRPLATSVGFGLLAVALLAPVSYPWYLLWGVTCVLAVEPPGRRCDLVVALCGVATVVSTPGLPGVVAGALGLASLVVALGLLAHRWLAPHPPSLHPATGHRAPGTGRAR